LHADPKRIEKIKNTKFPENKKGMRAFLGLTNSLRKVTGINFIILTNKLAPLTSSTVPYDSTPEQGKIFEEIKQKFIIEPLFCNLIDVKAPKYLFGDAATSTGTLGAVLAQFLKIFEKTETNIPNGLDLNNKIDRIIYDKKWKYLPVKIYFELPETLPKPEVEKTVPMNLGKNQRWKVFGRELSNDSLSMQIASFLRLL